MYIDWLGVVGGIVVFLIGSSLSVLFYGYHKIMEAPARQWGRRIVISLILFAIGGIGVIIDSVSESKLWFLAAIPITLSYLLAISASLHYIRRLRTLMEIPSANEMKRPCLPPGAYITRKSPHDLRELLMLMRENSNGLVVAGRKPKERFIQKAGIKPDKYIWLSRTASPESVDPAKLHVLQQEILSFVRGRKGSVVVYLSGFDYLILYNEFTGIVKFLFNLKDYIMMNASVLLLHLPEDTIDSVRESIIAREFEWLDESRLLSEMEELALFGIMKREGEPDAGSEGSQRKGGKSEEALEEA